MKIAVLALCVVLPSICLCTPLPDYSVAAGSNSGASVQTTGNSGPVSANSSSNSNVSVGAPPAVSPTTVAPAVTPDATTPPTPDSTQPPCTGTPPPSSPTSVNVNTSSDSNVNVNQQGGSGQPPSVSANTSSDSNVNVNQQGGSGQPPSVSANTSSDSNVNVNQQGGSGQPGSVSANASSSASASVTVSGNKCGKPDVDGFNNYSVLVKNQGDIQKFTSGNWMVWKSSSSTTKIETQEPVCAPRYLDQSCKASQYKITVISETDILYEVWGYNGVKILYIKQKLSITSQQFHIYTSQVVSIAEAANGSQDVIAVQNEQTIKQYFDNGQFAILDTDYDTYMICTTSGQNGVTFVSLSQHVYESAELKQQVSQKVDQVLKVNNLSSVQFIEVSNKFDVDVTKYQWDKCSQGGQGGQGGTNINANAGSSSSVDVNQNNGTPNGPAGDDKTTVKAGSDSSANVNVNQNNNGTPNGPAGGDKTSVKAGSDSSSKVDVTNNNNGSPGGSPGGTDVHADANSNANASVNTQGSGGGSSGKPTEQGFTNYSVLKVCTEEFQKQIDKTTWYVAKYTPPQQEVKSDVTVCADRCVSQNCKAVKFQYVNDKGCFVMKEWGYDGQNLMYIQEKISFVTKDFVIIKAEVVNVMKATKDSDVAVKVDNSDQVKSYLSSEYAVLGTDYKHYFIGQTSCDQGSITFVAYIQEIYECEEKQQQYAQQISQILKDNGIDESKLQKLTQKFDVDTNKYNKVKSETDVSNDGKTTTTKQETEHEGSGGKTSTETSVTNGPSPGSSNVSANTSTSSNVSVDANQGPSPAPSSGGTNVNANASSDANVNVNTNNGPTPPATPSGGGTSVDVNSSSNSNVNVNNNNNGTPPCTGTPPPPSPPPCTTPPSTTPPPSTSPPAPSSINANASSGSNASVNTTGGGNTTVDANTASDANVTVNNGAP